ncbi:MAG TPA: PAS domain S-box protein [Myxococcota bacterium]|nr:PAS domain S-box protein [Myxococcota bacterium]
MLRRLARLLRGRAVPPLPGLQAILEATPNLIGISVDDRVVYANGASQKLLGLGTRRELLGRSIYGFIHPDDRTRVQAAIEQMLRTGLSVRFFEVRFVAQDGEVIDLEVWLAPIQYRGQRAILMHGRDERARRRAEAELRENEARYRLLAENSWDIVSEYTAEGKLVWVSPSIERVLGYTPQQWAREMALGIERLTHPDDLPLAAAQFEDCQLRPTVELVQRVRHADGEWRWLETHGQSFTSPEGRRHMVMTTRDVTEERRAVDALRESEKRFQSLARAVPVGIFRIDHRGRHVYLNERWAELTGVPVAQALGTIGNGPLHPEDAAKIIDLSRKALAEGRPLVLEQRIVRPDGEVRWILNQSLPEFRPDGRFAGWVGTLTDLSEKKASERALAESEERLRLALEGADMCTWEWDAPGATVRWSPNAARIFGLPEGQPMPGSPEGVFALVHPDDLEAARTFAFERTQQGETFDVEFRLCPRPGGETRWLLMRGHGIAGRSGSAVGVVAEVTQRRRLAEERGELEARLRESQRLESLGLLAGGVAHDFNNLLVGILGNSELALERSISDPVLRESLEEIQRSGERAAGLVRQILAFAGRERIELEPLDLRGLVDDTLALLRASLPARAKIDWLPPAAPACVEGDATQLRQVLMNLLTNACEALPADGGTVALRVTADGADAAPHAVTLEVADTGCGVDAEALAKIFDPFFTTKGAGRGLGLAVAHGIVRAHHGTVLVESAPGRGTRMRVVLPATQRAPAAPPERAPRAPAPATGRGAILVIDDERGVREVARRALEAAGYEVLVAQDRAEALERLRAHAGRVSAVLLDLTLANESGETVYAALRELAPGVPVLATSGYAADHALRRLESQGIAGFVQKPFSAASLVETVQRALS